MSAVGECRVEMNELVESTRQLAARTGQRAAIRLQAHEHLSRLQTGWPNRFDTSLTCAGREFGVHLRKS